MKITVEGNKLARVKKIYDAGNFFFYFSKFLFFLCFKFISTHYYTPKQRNNATYSHKPDGGRILVFLIIHF